MRVYAGSACAGTVTQQAWYLRQTRCNSPKLSKLLNTKQLGAQRQVNGLAFHGLGTPPRKEPCSEPYGNTIWKPRPPTSKNLAKAPCKTFRKPKETQIQGSRGLSSPDRKAKMPSLPGRPARVVSCARTQVFGFRVQSFRVWGAHCPSLQYGTCYKVFCG